MFLHLTKVQQNVLCEILRNTLDVNVGREKRLMADKSLDAEELFEKMGHCVTCNKVAEEILEKDMLYVGKQDVQSRIDMNAEFYGQTGVPSSDYFSFNGTAITDPTMDEDYSGDVDNPSEHFEWPYVEWRDNPPAFSNAHLWHLLRDQIEGLLHDLLESQDMSGDCDPIQSASMDNAVLTLSELTWTWLERRKEEWVSGK